MEMNNVEFKKIFYELFGEFVKNPKKVDQLYNDVIKRYTAKGRHYHDINHIYGMCDLWVQYQDKMLRPKFILFAIIYHDIIYKVTKSDNEEESAEYFHTLALKSHFSLKPNEIVYIKDLIKYTKHDCFFDLRLHKDAQFLLDFDLYGLSSPEETYNQNSLNIRKEYKLYSNFLYNKGRADFLQKFLKKEKIYLTEEFSVLEENARKNMANEIIYLTSPKKRNKV
jgi:predicted metal-dependent HD superfamily phosphohydrolase